VSRVDATTRKPELSACALCVLYLFWNLLVSVAAMFSTGIIKEGEDNHHAKEA
jgi:hypothetical protein